MKSILNAVKFLLLFVSALMLVSILMIAVLYPTKQVIEDKTPTVNVLAFHNGKSVSINLKGRDAKLAATLNVADGIFLPEHGGRYVVKVKSFELGEHMICLIVDKY